MHWIFILLAIWLLLLVIADVYNLAVADNRASIVARLVAASLITGLIYMALLFCFNQPVARAQAPQLHLGQPHSGEESPGLVAALILVTGVPLLITWRLGYVQFFTSAPLRRRAVVVGVGPIGRALVSATDAQTGEYEYIGFVDEDPSLHGNKLGGVEVLGGYAALRAIVAAHNVDEVIVALPCPIEGELFQALTSCHEQGVEIKPMSRVYEDVLGQVPVEYLGPHWFLNASRSSFPTLYRLVKRLLDLAVGSVGMVILMTLLPFIALAIYLDSRGPIFYRQERCGRYGKPFYLYKFRSMIPNAEQVGQARWAASNDPRVTRVGKFMRRTRIDELPQFINIFRGDMSVVGPRPERPQFVAQLEQQIPFYRARLCVKPGLTGWAQVRYRYGSSVADALVKLKYDLYYIKNRSLLLDLIIICRTVGVVLAMRGT